MKNLIHYFPRLAIMATLSLVAPLASAAQFTWSGTSGTDLLWATPGNWTPAGPPVAADAAWFNNTALTNGPGAAFANNIVAASATIAALQYSNNTAGFSHNMVLNPGVVLVISNTAVAVDNLSFGSGVNLTSTITNTISGPGAALIITNTLGRINIRSTGAANSGQNNMLDLSGLDIFRAGVARLQIGSDASLNREVGTLYLAKTNSLILSGTAPQISIGDNPSNGAGANNDPTLLNSFLYLGKTNAIFADSITVGRQKGAGTMMFNPAFTNGATPSVYLRGSSGSRVTTFSVSDQSPLGNSNQRSYGLVDFSGGTVDAMLGTIYIGRGKNGNNTSTFASEVGTLTFSQGTIDANTLEVGYQTLLTGSGIGSVGTVNVNGTGTLIVNTTMELSHGSGSQSPPAQGTLNVNGGTVTVKGSIISGGGTGTINVNGGSLNVTNIGGVIGTVSAPISTLSVSNSILRLLVNPSVTTVVADTLTSAGNNVINIAKLTGFASYPAQVTLVKYSGSIGGSGFGAFSLMLPSGAAGTLVDNTGNSSIDVNLTSGPIAVGPLTWTGLSNGVPVGNWDIGTTTNWLTSTLSPSVYQDANPVTFDDSATGATNINLTTVMSPTSVTISNTAKNYSFSGSGRITGSASLTKTGTGTVIFDEAGGNDFSGGAVISAGTVQIGGANNGGGIGSGPVQNDTSLVFAGNNSFSVPGVISGAGTLTQNGNGTLTLGGANSFAGNLTINSGTVRLTAVGAPGTSQIVVNSGGTVIVGAALSIPLTLSNATLGSAGLGNNGTFLSTTDITNAAGASTIILADPQSLTAGSDVRVSGTLHGTGNILVRAASNANNADQGNGLRLQGTGISDYSGTITLSNGVKGEVVTAVAGPFSSAGTAKFILICGTIAGDNTANGNYSLFQVRNTSGGNTYLGHDIELRGSGSAVLNFPVDAPAGSIATLGALTISNGQELVVSKNSGAAQVFAFTNTTLLGGGNVTFTPRKTGFGNSVPALGSDLILTNINEQVAGTSLTMAGLRTLTLAGVNAYSGNTIINSGTLALVGDSGLTNSPVVTVAGPATLDLSGRTIPTLALASGHTLAGGGAVVGSVVSGPGTVLIPGDSNDGTLSVSTDLTLNNNSNRFLLATGVGDTQIAVAGTLTLGGTNAIRLEPVAGLPVGHITTLFQYGTLVGDATNLRLSYPTNYTFSIIDPTTTPGFIQVKVESASGSVVWRGGLLGSETVWNTGGASNWIKNSSSSVFSTGDLASFDDTALTNLVSLTGTLQPSAVFVNSASNYTFVGTGKLTGTGGLAKDGTGLLILANSGSNDFTGSVNITGGTLQVGNGGANGNLPPVSTIDNAALVFNHSDNITVSNIISGSGTLTQNGNGVLTLAGANTFTGGATAANGTIKPVAIAALGATATPMVITNTGTLDVNGINFSTKNFLVSGTGVGNAGAIINNGAQQNNAFLTMTLTGDTTFGGTNRWDIRGTGAALSTEGNPYKITKVGPNQVSFVSTTVDGALGDVDIQAGTFAIQTTTVALSGGAFGDAAHTITVRTNATLDIYNFGGSSLNKVVVLYGNSTLFSENSVTAISGPVTLTNGVVTINVNNGGANPSLTLSGTVDGNGGITKIGATNLIITTATTYTGSTTISNGMLSLTGDGSITNSQVITVGTGATLDASGRSDGTLTLASGQTLRGFGSIVGILTAGSGSTVAPGGSIGTLTVSGDVTLGGTTLMEINKAGSTNDVLRSAGGITYGGTLVVTNLGGSFTGGESYKIFDSGTVSYLNSFSSVQLPSLPSGLSWVTNQLAVSGTLSIGGSIATSPSITSIFQSGTNVIVSGTNGVGGGTYYVLSSTNVALPLASWTRLLTNTFNGSGNFIFTNAVSAGTPQRFYLLQIP